MFNYTYEDLMIPCFQAIDTLGGSATISEIDDEIAKILNLTDEEINYMHDNSTTKLKYRAAWARTNLKNVGYIENSKRGVWSITSVGKEVEDIQSVDLINRARQVKSKKNKKDSDLELIVDNQVIDIECGNDEYVWKDEILEIVKKIEPDRFEKLCQRLLRELGFVNVEVTKRSCDGGIDGKGILKLGGVLSFHVVFQAKRYSGTVGASIIRDFRGAMVGRADKGLVITTGIFSRKAIKEAQRDGATPIDVIDGDELTKHLKELGLGVEVEMVEKITIDKDWFENI
ncbi:restriction endonuclease [Clostridioides difficile]